MPDPDLMKFKYRSKTCPVQFIGHPKTGDPVFAIAADYIAGTMNDAEDEMALALFVEAGPMPDMALFSPMDKPTALRFLREMTAAVARMKDPAKHDEPAA